MLGAIIIRGLIVGMGDALPENSCSKIGLKIRTLLTLP